jgi:signal transduction histidine kinase
MSVRARVTALAVVVVVAVLALSGVALALLQRHLLTDSLDDLLRERSNMVAFNAFTLSAGLGADDSQRQWPERLGRPGDDDTMAQIVLGGRVVAASQGAPSTPLAAPPPAGRDQVLRGRPGLRVFSRAVNAPGDEAMVVHVAGSMEDIDGATRALVTTLAVAVPATALLLAALTWVLVGRTLGPVEAIRAEVADIGAGALDRRVPVPSGDDEIARLARTMNQMLARVEAASARQDRFVADASHELRGPLTRIRTELEVDQAHPAAADPEATAASVLEEVHALQRLVEDLLMLARGDAGAALPRPGPVDLDDVVMEEALRLRAAGTVTVDAGGVSAAQVTGDRAQLARAVANLVDNAARHARGTVTLTLAEQGGQAVLGVADDGPGIPAAASERVFERFTRLDAARSNGQAGGAGLGLAIARDIVARHGGTLTVDPGHHPGARLVMRLPAGTR